jgi:hypothetical protein
VIDFYVNTEKKAANEQEFIQMIRNDHITTLDVYSWGVTLMFLLKQIIFGNEGMRSYSQELDRDFNLLSELSRLMVKCDGRINQEQALREYDRILESKGYEIREARSVPEQPSPEPVQDAVPSPQAPSRVSAVAEAAAGAGAEADVEEEPPKPMRNCRKIKDAKTCNATEGCFYMNRGRHRYCRKGTRNARRKQRGGRRKKGQTARKTKSSTASAPTNPRKTAKRQYCRKSYRRNTKSGAKTKKNN